MQQKTYPPRRLARPQKLVQLTDCHLYADPDAVHKGVRPGRTLEHVLRHIARRHSDLKALLLTGDLSEDESAASYEWLKRSVLQFGVPVYAIPGNHDNSQRMHAAFAGQIGIGGTIGLSHWKIYLLDSTVPGETAGLLAQQELDRLRQELQRFPVTPTLVVLHHHPVPVGSAWMDRLGLRNGKALNSLLLQHPQVKAVAFGHIHQEFLENTGSVLYLGTPSTCIQFRPGSPLYAPDNLPPACRVFNLRGDGIFDTHVEYVPVPAKR
ncbi:MAG TPA: metallophosphoesterase [Gammaproteobacteria bacterium]|nr:metallophosphoesterase [Gammaproteobacteria bacterium]